MRVIEFELEEVNFVVVDEEKYFVLELGPGRHLVCKARCPHRGGPLNLGRMDCQQRTLTCPWHGLVLSCKNLERQSVPATRTGGKVTVLFPAGADTPIQLQRRRVLANER